MDAATDYDLACDVEDYLGLINVGQGKALVLGGGEFATTWFPLSENREGILIRWECADSEVEIIDFASSLPNNFEKETNIELSVEGSELILFVAAESGNDKIYPRLSFNLSSGVYDISTIERQDEQTSVICHHFRKIV